MSMETIKWLDKLPWLSDLNECLVCGFTLPHSSLFFFFFLSALTETNPHARPAAFIKFASIKKLRQDLLGTQRRRLVFPSVIN